MRPLIVALLLLAPCAAIAQFPSFDPNKKVDGHNDVNGRSMFNSQRMPELPSGPNKLDCWIVLSDNWQNNPLEYAIAAAVKSDPRMQQIKAGTYFNYYTVSNPKFSQSGLVQAVGTAAPILVVSRHDGAIAADGNGGLFVNAKSCPQTADDIVDLLCDALSAANPPPRVDGQTTTTPIVRDTTAEQCPPNQPCPPITPPGQPTFTGTIPTIRPNKASTYFAIGLGVLAVFGFAAGGFVWGFTRYLRNLD